MRGDLSVRKVRTASGAVAVQLIRYNKGKRIIVRHIGSSHTNEELAALCREAEIVREQLCNQPSLFSTLEKPSKLLHEDHLQLSSITHHFSHRALRNCAQICGLAFLHPLYQDLALMRIIELVSKCTATAILAPSRHAIGTFHRQPTTALWHPSSMPDDNRLAPSITH